MDAQFYAYVENPDNIAEVLRDMQGPADVVLAWARNQANEGYSVYVFDGNEQRVEL